MITGLGVVELPVFGLAFAISLTAALRLYRQRLTAYRTVRTALLSVYGLIILMMALDLYRITVASVGFMTSFFPVIMILGLAQAVMLVAAALEAYANPMGDGRFLKDLTRRPSLAVLFFLFIAAVAVVVGLALAMPAFSTSTAVDFASNVVPSVMVNSEYVLALVGVYAFFICYPSILLIAAARRVPNTRLRGSLYLLPAGWVIVSGFYLGSEPFAWLGGHDLAGAMYVVNAAVFFLITRNFSRMAALAGFVKPTEVVASEAEAVPSPVGPALEGNVLLITDPTSSFEKKVLELATNLHDRGNSVFLFTRNGSRLRSVSAPEIRTYLLTSLVSHIKPTENPSEVLLPEDTAIILDALAKTYGLASEGKVVVFYDSMSDMIVSKGFDAAYRFMKQAAEMGSDPNTTTFFMIFKGAHDDKIMNLISATFSNQVLCDDGGFRQLR